MSHVTNDIPFTLTSLSKLIKNIVTFLHKEIIFKKEYLNISEILKHLSISKYFQDIIILNKYFIPMFFYL